MGKSKSRIGWLLAFFWVLAAGTVRAEETVYPTVSGNLLTPTAYLGNQKEGIGLGLDINTSYYIGRLYGKNTYDWTIDKTNYIDRVGVWFLSADGKMQIQKEGRLKPALAVGVDGTYTFRDAPQPSLQTGPQLTVNVTQKTNRALTAGYVVASKKILPRLHLSVGYLQGNSADKLSMLSEFLTPESLNLSGHRNQKATSDGMLFGGFVLYLTKNLPLQVEYMKLQGAPASPSLINIKIGRVLHLNFDIAYLKFEGGWDVLGFFNFRWTYFPKR